MAEKPKRAGIGTRLTNAALRVLIGKFGLSPQGAELLEVRGRKTGKPQIVPVNPVMVGGTRYLFSPHGESQWVKNIRAAGEGTLRVGRRAEHFRAVEVPDAEKVPIIRAYFDRWYWQIRGFVDVPKDADDATLRSIASDHPIFRIVPSSMRLSQE